jgi:Ser/Thr protein kinase RdoA (MazF antagonist)
VSNASAEPLHARGRRRNWSELPNHIVEQIESVLGGRIRAATTMEGGFSPGIAAKIATDSGPAFVKAVSGKLNPGTEEFHRREIQVATRLNDVPDLPVPRLLWSLDDNETGWVVLVFERVDGHLPAQPWIDDELERVIAGMNRLSRQLTPSPLAHPDVPLAREKSFFAANHWLPLRDEPDPRLDAWCTRHLDRLIDLTDLAPDAIKGETLLHLDLRADNVLLTTNEVCFVDWPHAGIGAAWLDSMAMAPSVTMHGGGLPEDFLARFDSARRADFDAVSAALAQLAGVFIRFSLQPEIPALPGLRAFQAAQGRVACGWLGRRLGWD